MGKLSFRVFSIICLGIFMLYFLIITTITLLLVAWVFHTGRKKKKFEKLTVQG